MASNLKNAKRGTGAVYPERAIDSTGPVDRYEPLMTASDLEEKYFFGVPMVSPITQKKVTKKMMNDVIKRALNLFELDSQLDVLPTIRRHRLSFDPNLYYQNIFLEIPNKPIRKVIRLAICSSNYRDINTTESQAGTEGLPPGSSQDNLRFPSGGEIYQIPNEWIEMGNAVRGYINVNPISPAFTAIGTATAVPAAGATILQFIGQQGWVPAYWTAEIVHGMMCEDGSVPVIVNEAIGHKASMLLIDNLLPLFRSISQSMGVDGLNQSINDNMLNLLQTKRDLAEKEYMQIVKRLKALYGNKFFSSNV
jgi:hypothetical protein